jgi:hypothetical protein
VKKLYANLILLILTLGLAPTVFAAAQPILTPAPIAYVFGSNDCNLCRDEVRLLFNEGIHFEYLNTSSSTLAKTSYEALLQKHTLHQIFPLTIIGPEVIVGYEKDQTTGHDIELAVLKAKKSDIVTVEDHLARAPVLAVQEAKSCEGLACDTTNLQTISPVPFLGLVNLSEVSKSAVALSLGLVTIPRLLSIGWLFVSLGLLILLPRRKYIGIAAASLALIEVGFYFYFFNFEYTIISRFVVEASFAKVLAGTTGILLRQWFVFLYSLPALIDNILVSVFVIKVLPYLRKFDDIHPGSIGMISSALFFIGGSVIVYFILFP